LYYPNSGEELKIARTNISEEKLIELVSTDKEDGFRLLYANYSAILYGIALKTVGSEELAKDVLQDAFVKIWKNFSSYDSSKGRLFTWMLNITRNTAIDYTRTKEFKKTGRFTSELTLESLSPSSEMKVDHIGVRDLLNLIDPESKLIIETVYMKSYTHSEAAEYLQLPLGTVKTRVRNGLIQLRKLMK
jgi:RNA polymerase sigma factor (sigma-70 family)